MSWTRSWSGHRFVRYADDFQVYVRSQRAGERVMASLERFLEKRLRLKVNRKKSAVGQPWKRKLLGYRTTADREPRLRPDPESVKRLRVKLKDLFRRGRGWSLGRTIGELNPILRGWAAYYRLADVSGVFEKLDRWIRRRLRLILWRQWKRPRTRLKELRKRGLEEGRAAEAAYRQGSVVERGVEPYEPGHTVQTVRADGTREPLSRTTETQVLFVNRRIRNRTSGGVGGL